MRTLLVLVLLLMLTKSSQTWVVLQGLAHIDTAVHPPVASPRVRGTRNRSSPPVLQIRRDCTMHVINSGSDLDPRPDAVDLQELDRVSSACKQRPSRSEEAGDGNPKELAAWIVNELTAAQGSKKEASKLQDTLSSLDISALDIVQCLYCLSQQQRSTITTDGAGMLLKVNSSLSLHLSASSLPAAWISRFSHKLWTVETKQDWPLGSLSN